MRKIAVLAAAVCFFFCLPAAYAQTTVSVHERSEVDGPDVLLGDVADIMSEDTSMAERLRTVKIANAAAPGDDLILTPQLVSIRLAGANLKYGDFAWAFPEKVRVVTRSQKVSGETLVSLVSEHIEARLDRSDPKRSYQTLAERIPRDCLLPVGKVRYEVELPYGIRYNAPTNAGVNVYVNETFYLRILVRMQVAMIEPVVVAVRSLAKGEVISPGDVHLQDLETSRLAAGYLTSLDEAVGMVARRKIPMGTPLAKSLLDKEILIQRSDIVNIVVNVNGVEISVEGQALQDGREGQSIRVKNSVSGRILTGKVIDETTVRVTTR